MDPSELPRVSGCCGSDGESRLCVFGKALLAQAASCRHAGRGAVGEHAPLVCADEASHASCRDWAAELRQRAQFALKLPPPGRPLFHAQSLKLQCGGLAALRGWLGDGPADAGEVVARAQRAAAEGEPPWPALVAAVAAWSSGRRR